MISVGSVTLPNGPTPKGELAGLILKREALLQSRYFPPPDQAQGALIVRASDLISEGHGLPFPHHATGNADTCIHLHLLIIYLSFL